jgi:hypothetical protein
VTFLFAIYNWVFIKSLCAFVHPRRRGKAASSSLATNLAVAFFRIKSSKAAISPPAGKLSRYKTQSSEAATPFSDKRRTSFCDSQASLVQVCQKLYAPSPEPESSTWHVSGTRSCNASIAPVRLDFSASFPQPALSLPDPMSTSLRNPPQTKVTGHTASSSMTISRPTVTLVDCGQSSVWTASLAR